MKVFVVISNIESYPEVIFDSKEKALDYMYQIQPELSDNEKMDYVEMEVLWRRLEYLN